MRDFRRSTKEERRSRQTFEIGIFTRRVSEKDVGECDRLQGFSQTHGVREDAAEAVGHLEPRRRLDDVVVQKTDAADLGPMLRF
jgi:hypothetical protein